MPRDVVDRILDMSQQSESGCWEFTGYLKNGYAYIGHDGSSRIAHRVMYEQMVADIAPGLHLDHLCRVRSCVNPWHLEPVTPQENARRTTGHRPLKTECKHGHPFDVGNTLLMPSGERRCRACSLERTNAWRQKHRDAISDYNRLYLAAHREERAAYKRARRAAERGAP